MKNIYCISYSLIDLSWKCTYCTVALVMIIEIPLFELGKKCSIKISLKVVYQDKPGVGIMNLPINLHFNTVSGF